MFSAADNSRPARVCIIRHSYYPDGHVRRDAETLIRAGFDVTVIALKRPGQASRERIVGVTVYRMPVEHKRGSPLRYAWEYGAFATLACLRVTLLHLRRRFQIVEVDNMPDILVFSAVVPRLTGAQIILYIFDNMPELLAHVWKTSARHPMVSVLAALEHISIRFAHQVVVTQEMARRTVVARGAPPDKVAVILNGPDESLFKRQLVEQRTRQPETFRIVTHGSLLERYGNHVLLHALPRIIQQIPNVRLDIYGDGEYRDVLEEIVSKTNLTDYVRFHGLVPIEDIPRYLLQADVGYVGILNDLMLTNKLIEYVALGVPAVVSRQPTTAHYFPDDSVRYFDAGDASGLAQAIIDVHDHPANATKRAETAYSRYQHYRWSVQKDIYLGVYADLMRRLKWSRYGNAGHPSESAP